MPLPDIQNLSCALKHCIFLHTHNAKTGQLLYHIQHSTQPVLSVIKCGNPNFNACDSEVQRKRKKKFLGLHSAYFGGKKNERKKKTLAEKLGYLNWRKPRTGPLGAVKVPLGALKDYFYPLSQLGWRVLTLPKSLQWMFPDPLRTRGSEEDALHRGEGVYMQVYLPNWSAKQVP